MSSGFNKASFDGVKTDPPPENSIRISAALSLIIFTIMALTITDIMQWIINTYAYVGVITPFIFYGVLKKAWSDKFLALGVLISSASYWLMYYAGLYENMAWYALPYLMSAAFVSADLAIDLKNRQHKA